MKRSKILKTIFVGIINIIALLVMSQIIPGFHVGHPVTLIAFAVVLGLLNAFLRPFLIKITLPVTILTLGFFSLFINAFLIIVAAEITKGVNITQGISIESFGVAIVISFGIAIVNSLMTNLLSIDDTDTYYRNVVKKQAGKEQKIKTDKPGIIFLEIDGLSHPVFQRAIQNAYLPTLSRWLHTTHKVIGWECDTASSTPACQAGILLGNNSNMPAFRWYDRKQQKTVTLGDLRDSADIEETQFKNKKSGLLSNNGVSINNMFSGGASKYVITSSKLLEKGGVRKQSSLYYFFVNPYTFIRVLMLSALEIYHEIADRSYQKRQDVLPRVQRGAKFLVMRTVTAVIMRDIGVNTVIGSMFEGVSTLYATFVGYDEVAHFAGNERSQAMFALQQLDKQFAKIEAAIKETPRPYHIVMLSDHGHSQGATFLQRYGYTLEDHVNSLIKDDLDVSSTGDTNEGWGHINALLTSIKGDDGFISSKVVNKIFKKHAVDDSIVIGSKDSEMKKLVEAEKDKDSKQSEVMVYASGNLGLVTFTGEKKRLTYKELNKKYPGLVDGIANHEGVGFVMVKTSAKNGGIVIGANGTHELHTGKITGKDPLKDFGKNAALHLACTNTYSNAPDILVNSMYDPGTGEVAGFEEMVSVHGGMGGNQNKPFLMYPKELEKGDLGDIVGAENLHKVLKKWTKNA